MFFLFANKKKFWVSYPPTSIQSRCLPYTSRYSDTRRCSILNCFYNRFKWYTDVNPNDIKPKEINANYCTFTRRRQKAEWHNHKIALFLHEKLCTEFENQFAERLNQSGVLSWTLDSADSNQSAFLDSADSKRSAVLDSADSKGSAVLDSAESPS